MNISSYFFHNSQKNPERHALWINGDLHTYEALHQVAASLARTIEELSPAGANAHVAICAHRSLSAYAGVLGALYAGRVYLPLNPRFPEERNRRMISVTEAKCLVVDQRFAASLPSLIRGTDAKLVLMPEHDAVPDWCAEMPEHRFLCRADLLPSEASAPPKALGGQEGAYTLFTSGSTGLPKGVMVRHANVASYLACIAELLDLRDSDRCTQHFDLTFDVSVHDMFATWKAGACLYVIPENSTLFGARFVTEHDITVWYSVPSTAALMKHHGFLKAGSMPSLRYSLFIGEALSVPLAEAWQTAAPQSALFNLYGPTEATVSITGYRFRAGETYGTEYVPIGRVHSGHEFAIVDEKLAEVPPGELGELCVSGPQITSGYWGEKTLTAAKFLSLAGKSPRTVWYRTGDLVHWREKFGLEFRGRADRQVKLRGFRVELSEIESAVRKSAATEMAAVVGVRSEKSGNFIGTVAFVCGSPRGEAEILAECRGLVPDYMVPDKVIFIAEMPVNANGKTDYRRLETEHLKPA